jgi:hypothetical protein
MKRILIIRMAIFSLFLTGLSFTGSSDQLQAQAIYGDSGMFEVPAGPFVSKVEAELRLNSAIGTIKTQLATHTEGTPQYTLTLKKYTCFAATLNSVVNNQAIGVAIVDGLKALLPDNEFVLPQDLIKVTIPAFRQELILLLKA